MWHASSTFQTVLKDDGWDSSGLTSTCEQSTVWVQLPGQGPETLWVLDYNIVQACPRYYFANMKDNLCFFIRVPFDTHSAANSEYLNDCDWPWNCFKKLLSPRASCSLVPLISLFLQSASREINISEGHSRRYTEPSSLPWRGTFLVKQKRQQKSHRTGDMGSHLLRGPITHWAQWSR